MDEGYRICHGFLFQRLYIQPFSIAIAVAMNLALAVNFVVIVCFVDLHPIADLNQSTMTIPLVDFMPSMSLAKSVSA